MHPFVSGEKNSNLKCTVCKNLVLPKIQYFAHRYNLSAIWDVQKNDKL